MAVTDKPKCYIFECAACGLLFESSRSDALTCSPACRVRAHRGTRLKDIRSVAEMMDVRPSDILRMKAINRLCPHLNAKIKSGEATFETAREEVHAAFIKLVMEEMRRRSNE